MIKGLKKIIHMLCCLGPKPISVHHSYERTTNKYGHINKEWQDICGRTGIKNFSINSKSDQKELDEWM